MKSNQLRPILIEELKKAEREIGSKLYTILGISFDVISSSFMTLMVNQPIFVPPLYAIINNFVKGYASFKDYRELEILVSFINCVNERSQKEKETIIKRLENDETELINKLVYYVIQQNDIQKSKIIGNIFHEFLIGNIHRAELENLVIIIEKTSFSTLAHFNNGVKNLLEEDDNYEYFITTKKQGSWECLELARFNIFKVNIFQDRKESFKSSGLLIESFNVQKIPEVLGNYKEEDQVKRLREASQNINIEMSCTYEGCLICRFGNFSSLNIE